MVEIPKFKDATFRCIFGWPERVAGRSGWLKTLSYFMFSVIPLSCQLETSEMSNKECPSRLLMENIVEVITTVKSSKKRRESHHFF